MAILDGNTLSEHIQYLRRQNTLLNKKIAGLSAGGTSTTIQQSPNTLGANISITNLPVKDEDNMSSNSDVHIATQQSIKAYADLMLPKAGGVMTGSLTVGVDDTGHDVKFFGATSGQYMLWDESADELVLAGDSKLSFNDAAGGENIIASSDGHLEINAGTTLDITAATTQVNASTLFDVNGDADISGTLGVTGVATLTATPIANAGMSVKNGSSSAGYVEFYENSGNGTNKVTLIGPASTADITLTLPSTAGTVATTASALDESVAMAIALG